jgi:hypothetical protein
MEGKTISPCGILCSECPSLNTSCKGCLKERGRIFWTETYKGGIETCPIFECCVNGRGLLHCGQCQDLPCDIYMGLSDPNDPDIEASKKECIERLRSI